MIWSEIPIPKKASSFDPSPLLIATKIWGLGRLINPKFFFMGILFTPSSSVSIVNFDHVIAGWEEPDHGNFSAIYENYQVEGSFTVNHSLVRIGSNTWCN